VEVCGYDVEREPSLAKAMIGLVPQEFNFNVFEPVEEIVVNQAGYYGINRNQAGPRAEQLLKMLGLWQKRREMARNLSGGMKRRLMIARALIHEPRLLILDEPTAGVDIEIRHSMWEFLRQINRQGTTIILTTHYLEEAENLCRHIGIIDEGELIENTSMKQLLAKLQMETFVLDLPSPLQQLPTIPNHQLRQVDDHTLEVDLSRERNINQLFDDLSAVGIQVQSMRNKTNRLEQLFMGLVEGKNR
jgi:ABC-2 type transport system ATP-binding protein